MKTSNKIFVCAVLILGLLYPCWIQAKDDQGHHDAVIHALNPRAVPPPVKLVPLSSRLDNLNGKVIYVVNEPGAEAELFLSRVVASLPGYGSGVDVRYRQKAYQYWTDDPALWNEIAANADAFIYGVAGHGSGSSWGAHWVAGLEKRGIPGVYIVGEPFLQDVLGTAEREGMPYMRTVLVHHPCRDIPIGDMPPIMQSIVNALTIPLTAEEQQTGIWQPPAPPRIAIKGSLAEVQKYFYEQGWTDGLPIIPPTEENIAEMLKGTSHAPDEIVAYPHPEKYTATVEKIAINAVMAGCKPEYMPVLMALIEAFSNGPYTASIRSTNSFSFMSFVNGPIRNEIGMNAGIGAMSPGNIANASIGRFLHLAMYNLGGGREGVNLMGSQGNTSNYSFTFAENEERSPWEPFHVEQGFGANESVVSVLSGGWSHGGNSQRLVDVVKYISSFEAPFGVVVMLDPLVAANYVKQGYTTKQALEEYLWSNSTMTLGEMRSRPYWSMIRMMAQGIDQYPGYGAHWWPESIITDPPETIASIYPRSQIFVLVVGGETNAYVTSWRMSYLSMASVDKWR
ncbi:MAG: hypothetical protein AB7Y74_00760 [Syntrophorhabdus sp.]